MVRDAQSARPRLTGLSAEGYDWTPGLNVARCMWSDEGLLVAPPRWALHDPEDVPASNCMCGFWMLDTWEQAAEKLRFPQQINFILSAMGRGTAIGAVEGWGKTAIHSDGNRCENARILGLVRTTFDPNLDLAQRIGLAYDVPVFDSGLALQEYVNS